MKATQLLHNLDQSLWLDNITRDLLDSSTLKRYIEELSVTRLTSNPTIFDRSDIPAADLIRDDAGGIATGDVFHLDATIFESVHLRPRKKVNE
jgi:transaldolase